MKTKLFAAAALATITAFGSAEAADLPAPPMAYKAPPAAVSTWTGCYIGAGAGYGMWTQDSSLRIGGVPATASITDGGKGWFGQGQGGCDYQFSRPVLFNLPLVVGAFADFEGGRLNGASDFPGFVGAETETSAWAFGARVGVPIAPRALTYFDGGFTQARFGAVNYNIAIAGGGPTGLSLAGQTYNGWFIGGGFEYALDWLPISGLFLKTEYRYSQFGAANVPLSGGVGGLPVVGASLNSQKATQLISTELVWRFNDPGASAGAGNAAFLPARPLTYKASPRPAATSWTGCYVGGGGGYGMWTQDSSVAIGGVVVTASQTNGGRGWFGQGQAGCDYQLPTPILNFPVLIGAFGDYDGGNIAGATSFPGVVGNERESGAWSAGGRVGAVVVPGVLTFFDGGFTQARFDPVGYNIALPGGGFSGVSLAGQSSNGWFLGSGLEYALNWLPVSGLFLKTEYRYAQLGSTNTPITAIGAIPIGAAMLNAQRTTQLISTELVWRFNWLGR